MKTPTDIAADRLPVYIGDSETTDGFDFDDMRAFAALAIEADRAQREPEGQLIVTFSDDDDTETEQAITVQQVAEMIDQGFTSGYAPRWELT